VRLVLRPPRWWWIVIAREHERRREAEQALRLTMASDLPVYGLGDEWQGSRDVRIGFCRATFRRGRLGLRVQDGPVIVDEITAHHESADGSLLMVTTHRRDHGDVDRRRLVNNFLSISWVIDDRRAVAPDEQDASESAARPPASSRAGTQWAGFEMEVDEVPTTFERYTIPGHWLALGVVNGQQVSIEGHGVSPEQRLSTVSDLPTWVRRPGVPTANRPLRELGDRLGDLFGLP
jgi:hypothetical protein